MDTKFILSDKDMPTQWYNIQADLPRRPLPPPLHPGTKQPIGPADLAPLFPMALIEQEVSQERCIEIPEEVREVYRIWRPTPLFRARRLEKALDTPAHIYYKYEGAQPGGQPQAEHRRRPGLLQQEGRASSAWPPRPAPASGAAPWRMACNFFGLECKVYMVKVSYEQKPYRRSMMETWGASVVTPAPATETNAGRADPGRRPELAGQPGHRHQRGGRGRRHPRRHQVLAGQRAQPRPAAPDRHRPGGAEADGDGRRVPGRGHRLRRRRQQLRRPGLPVRARDKLDGKETRFVAVEPHVLPHR